MGAALPVPHARALRRLVALLDARASVLALCVCDAPDARRAVEAALADRLAPRTLATVDVPAGEGNPWSWIAARSADASVVSVALGSPNEPLTSSQLAVLNLGRELARRSGWAVLLWVWCESGLRQVHEAAPDLWAWRSDVCFFLSPLRRPPTPSDPSPLRRAREALHALDAPLRTALLPPIARASVHVRRAQLLLALGRPDLAAQDAAAIHLSALAADASSAEHGWLAAALTVVCGALREDGRIHEALQQIERVVARVDGASSALHDAAALERASCLAALHDHAGALRCSEAIAIAARPESIEGASVWRARARSWLSLGHLDRARAALLAIPERPDEGDIEKDTLLAMGRVEALTLRAELSYEANDCAEALVLLREAEALARERVGGALERVRRAQAKVARQLGFVEQPAAPLPGESGPSSLGAIEGMGRRMRLRHLRQELSSNRGHEDRAFLLYDALAEVAAELGRWDDAARYLRWLHARAEAGWGAPMRSDVCARLAQVALAQGEPREALRWSEEAARHGASDGESLRSHYAFARWMGARARCLLALDDARGARDTWREVRETLEREGLRRELFAALLALAALPAAAAEADERMGAARAALDMARAAAIPLEEARSMAAIATIYLERGEPQAARPLLVEAEWLAQALGDEALRRRVLRALQAL